MSGTNDFRPGLEGVVAFETQIAEPDKEGGSLRYRGIDIEELVGKVHFEQVWGLLVDESLEPGLPASYCPQPVRTGGYMSDLQAALAILSVYFAHHPIGRVKWPWFVVLSPLYDSWDALALLPASEHIAFLTAGLAVYVFWRSRVASRATRRGSSRGRPS